MYFAFLFVSVLCGIVLNGVCIGMSVTLFFVQWFKNKMQFFQPNNDDFMLIHFQHARHAKRRI